METSSSIRVAVVRHANASRMNAVLTRLARRGVQIALFPQARADDDVSPDDIAQAVERSGVAAGVGYIERTPDGRRYDSYALCMPGGVRVRHRALQVDGGHFHAGERFTVFDTPFGLRVGVLIGDDNDVVENVRMTALMGATLLIAPFADDAKCDAGRIAARAVDNGMYIAASGAGVIAAPDGIVLVSGEDGIAEIDPALADASAGRRALSARRPDLYAALARETGAYPLAIDARRATARGALPLAFAVVTRNRI